MSEFTAFDHACMARALQIAELGLYTSIPNPRVGCVIARDEKIIGEGWHARAGGPHAEVLALREAGEQARGATAYVSLEPCSHHGRTPPCADALLAAGIGRVVAAMTDPNPEVAGRGLQRLREAGVEVSSGLMENSAEALNPGFIQRMRSGRPYVRCKMAMSLDGRTAMASGESKWITGPAAREDVQRLRARSCAIITGVGTVLADDPNLTVRLPGLDESRQPLRVVLDPRLSMPVEARLLQQPGDVLIVTASNDQAVRESLERDNTAIVHLPDGLDRIDLPGLLHLLGENEINEVLLETGATLAGAMLQAGLVDELIVYMAPVLMGDAARGLFHLPEIEHMAQRRPLKISDVRAVGEDWRITATPLGQD